MKKLISIILATLMAMATLVGCSQNNQVEENQEQTDSSWDREVDFLVVGYGLAGEAAALEASDIDPNAKILVVEKMSETLAGGNSIASGQTFVVPAKDDVETFKTYLKAMNEPNPIPEEYVDWLANEFADQTKWISGSMEAAGYEVGYVGGGPARWGSLVVEFGDLPGANFKGASCHIREIGTPSFMPGGLWHGFNAAVKQRENIEVSYETTALDLIQDPETKRVEGIIAKDSSGKEIRIKANKGVLLACGGFENNLEMQKNLHGIDEAYTSGTPGNTGDGIAMLMRAGAKMWHMKNQTQSGGFWLGLKVPDFESTFILNMTFKTGEYLQVDNESKRFYDESRDYHRQHMKAKEHGKYLDLPHDEALPVHFIFDENFRQNNLVVSPWLSWPITTEGYKWSEDNSAEIEKGWIIKADTIEELAEKTNRDPEALKKAIDEFNAMVDKGEDTEFGRDINKMAKIQTAPYYAVEIVPTLVATTGGAVRNTNSQVLDWNENIIPNLYEAGELGSYVSNLYQNGVFLSEAIASGRAAAQHALGGKSTVTSDFEVLDAVQNDENSIFSDEKSGTYKIECESMHGKFIIEAKISEGKIALIEVVEGRDQMFMEDDQLRELIDNIVAEQSADIDVISGATTDSQSILDGLKTTFSKED